MSEDREKNIGKAAGEAEDVEGHGWAQPEEKFANDEGGDVEGHGWRQPDEKYAKDEGDEVEGHGFTPPGGFTP